MPAAEQSHHATQDPDLIVAGPEGLACAAGAFHVDPWKPVPLAVVTHAHADHATPGCGRYITTPRTAAFMRTRFGGDPEITELEFGHPVDLNGVRVSLHPAGHTPGSAQVRLEHDGRVWCVTGDYKRDADTTSEPFELVECDALITESTFGLPIFRWPDAAEVAADINAWRQKNAEEGATSVLLAYAFGKAQRVMALLDPSIGPIGVHGAVARLCAAYQDLGVSLPEWLHAKRETRDALKGAGTIVAPPSVAGSTWLRGFAGKGGVRTAMVSGWMTIRGRRRWRALDAGFVLSDHADWPGLLRTIEESGATRVGVTHGYAEPMARYLREVKGLDAFAVPTRFRGEDGGEENADDDRNDSPEEASTA